MKSIISKIMNIKFIKYKFLIKIKIIKIKSRIREQFPGIYKIISLLKNILLPSLLVSFFYNRTLKEEKIDILFLHITESIMNRTKNLSRELEKEGFLIKHEVKKKYPKEIIENHLLYKPSYRVPFGYRFIASYASFLVKKYKPKIILTFANCDLFSIFLRKEINKIGGKLINISHSVTGSTEEFYMFDFDYYFVFGPSSVENTFKNPNRYGNTKLILAGSFNIDADFTLPPNYEKKKILFFSSWIEHQYGEILLRNFELIANWIKLHPEYELVIKLHTLENPLIIREIFKETPNVKVLPKDVSIKNALEDVSISIVSWSNAAIESALLNRPVVIANDSDLPDSYLNLEKYFLPRARTPEELQQRIEETFNNYDYFLKVCQDFVKWHLAHTTDSVPYMVKCIKAIIEGKENFEYFEIEGNMNRRIRC